MAQIIKDRPKAQPLLPFAQTWTKLASKAETVSGYIHTARALIWRQGSHSDSKMSVHVFESHKGDPPQRLPDSMRIGN
jgi:hypothetical protein